MNETVLMWCATAAAGVTFLLFGWTFADAVHEGAEMRAGAVGREASREFEEIFLFISPERIARLGRIGAIAAFFLFFIPLFSFTSAVSTVCGVALGLGAGAFVFTLPKRYVAFLRGKRLLKFNMQLPEALAAMSNALRAGFSINQAFESVVETGENPIAQEFDVFLRQMRVGMSFEESLASLEKRMESEDLTLVATAIDIARKTGGNLTEIFERIADTIRGRQRIENRVRTLTAQGRMQGIVVSLMPLLLGGVLLIMKPSMMIPFVTSVPGMACIATTVVLEILGWIVIKKIITIDV